MQSQKACNIGVCGATRQAGLKSESISKLCACMGHLQQYTSVGKQAEDLSYKLGIISFDSVHTLC